ncbi:GTPase Era [Oscillospiraceae bacterium HV4-5-C5C]|nr:GTPase Era [Oscillospiraceae bacterium HV4-5-C5C]
MKINLNDQLQLLVPALAAELLPQCEALADAIWSGQPASSDPQLRNVRPFINLMLLPSDRIRQINLEQRGIDQTTDVLSFPAHDLLDGSLRQPLQAWDFELAQDEGWEEGEAGVQPQGDERWFFLGDILLNPERVKAQAAEYGHSEQREFCYLLAHACLHLCGYDHQTGPDEKRMNELCEAALTKLNLTRTDGKSLFETLPPQSATPPAEPDTLPSSPADKRSTAGFICIAGRPNAGKSTLLNRLAGLPLAITSPRAQTTRQNIRLIVNRPHSQLVFLDTPGLHKPDTKLGERMMEASLAAAREADVLLLLLDCRQDKLTTEETAILEQARQKHKPLLIALNKTDKARPEDIPTHSQLFYDLLRPQAPIVPLSAVSGAGVEDLLTELERLLPPGAPLYDPDDYTDQTERQMAAELLRQEILLRTRDEIPHGTAVLIDRFEELNRQNLPVTNPDERSLVRIQAEIFCDKNSHKGIIIGKNGSLLKIINQNARQKMETLLGCKVYLQTFVKVRLGWRDQPLMLNQLGYKQTKS